jgi:hypothetical protein
MTKGFLTNVPEANALKPFNCYMQDQFVMVNSIIFIQGSTMVGFSHVHKFQDRVSFTVSPFHLSLIFAGKTRSLP